MERANSKNRGGLTVASNIVDINEITYSQEMLEAKPPKFFSIFSYILIFILLVFCVWAYFGELDTYAKALGIVRPNENIVIIKNLVSGKVLNSKIEDGSAVKIGDILFSIENDELKLKLNSSQQDLDTYNKKLENLNKYRKCIESNLNIFDKNNLDELIYYTLVQKFLIDQDYTLKQVSEDKATTATQKESAILVFENARAKLEQNQKSLENYNLYKQSLLSNLNLFTKDETKFFNMYEDYNIKLESLQKKLDYAESAYLSNKLLYESGVISEKEFEISKSANETANQDISKLIQSELLNADSNINVLKNQIETDQISLKQAEQSINTYEIVKESSDILANKNKYSLLASIDSDIEITEEKIKQLKDIIDALNQQLDDSVVKAPISGIVNLNGTISSGEFFQSGQELGTIVPENNDKLKVSLSVSNKDISSIKVGQNVKLKIEALPYKEYGKVDAEVIKISADIKNSTDANKYYLVETSMDNRPLKSYKNELKNIKVGMIVEGQIVTERKKIWRFILEKLNFIE